VVVTDLGRRQFGHTRQELFGQGAGEQLAGVVVGDLPGEDGADALDDAAPDLAFDDHRVDHRAAILGDGEVEELDEAGLGVDRGCTDPFAPR
jgi:hypothetical protein